MTEIDRSVNVSGNSFVGVASTGKNANISVTANSESAGDNFYGIPYLGVNFKLSPSLTKNIPFELCCFTKGNVSYGKDGYMIIILLDNNHTQNFFYVKKGCAVEVVENNMTVKYEGKIVDYNNDSEQDVVMPFMVF